MEREADPNRNRVPDADEGGDDSRGTSTSAASTDDADGRPTATTANASTVEPDDGRTPTVDSDEITRDTGGPADRDPDEGETAPSSPPLERRSGQLTAVLALLSVLTGVYLGALEGALTAAVGAVTLGVGFMAFLIGDALDSRFSLEPVEAAWGEHRLHVGFAAGLFGMGILLGMLLYGAGVDLMGLFAELLEAEFGDELGEEGMPGGAEFELTATFFITQNTPPFLLAIVGAFSLGILTFVVMVFNGVLVGNIALGAGAELGFGQILALLIPHGVFELTALFVTAGIGFRLVHRFGQRLLGSRESFLTKAYVYETTMLVVYAWFVLVLAAFVEAYLTIPIAELLFGGGLEPPDGTTEFVVSAVVAA